MYSRMEKQHRVALQVNETVWMNRTLGPKYRDVRRLVRNQKPRTRRFGESWPPTDRKSAGQRTHEANVGIVVHAKDLFLFF